MYNIHMYIICSMYFRYIYIHMYTYMDSHVFINSFESIGRQLTSLFFKWAKDLNNYFTREDIQTGNKYIKICSTSLLIRKIKQKGFLLQKPE